LKNHALRFVCYVLCMLLMLGMAGCAAGEELAIQMEQLILETEEASIEHRNAVGQEEIASDKSEEQADVVSGDSAIMEEVSVSEETEVSEPVLGDEVPDLLYRQGSCYAHQRLSEAEALWYDDMAACIGRVQDKITLNQSGLGEGLDEGDIDRIFQCVLMDHPELFYVDGYTYTRYNRGEKIVGISFAPTYAMERKQILVKKAEIEQEAEGLILAASGLVDEYDKVKYVYETLICNTQYDLSAPDNQNIYSVFVNHVSVCQGYAKAVQYLLERLGVECTLVQGSVDTGEGHAWNLVKVNDSYYYVDATWGDASYLPEENGQESEYVPQISYDYLCITTNQLLQTHMLAGAVEFPVCVDSRDNYYVRENALFTTYDREQMRMLFDKINTGACKEVSLKCDRWECYQEIWNAMIEEQEIFDYFVRENTSVHYVNNEKQLSMSFWVTNE